MKIGICNDHAGVEYKNQLVEYLTGKGHEMVNFGTDTTASMDYPDVANIYSPCSSSLREMTALRRFKKASLSSMTM